MGLTITSLRSRARFRIELRWWWEAAPPGRPVVFRDAKEARAYLASVYVPAEHAVGLRTFLLRDTPWLSPPPDDREVVRRLSAAMAAGRVRVAERPPEAFPTWDGGREKPLPSAPVFTVPADPWPAAPEPRHPAADEERTWSR